MMGFAKARQSGNRAALVRWHRLRRSLGVIGRIGRRGVPPLVVFFTYQTAKRGWADDGALGAGQEVIRDLVFADEVEYLARAAAYGGSDFIADQLVLPTQPEMSGTLMRLRGAGIEYDRELFSGGLPVEPDE